MNMEIRDFRVIFLYQFKLGHSAAEAARSISKPFAEGSVNERTIRHWSAKFSKGNWNTTELENVSRGRPPTIDDNVLKLQVEENYYQTVKRLAAQLNANRVKTIKEQEKSKSLICGSFMSSRSDSG
ncbi:histone-lysine N-methyltransferase SETMAR-like [Cimex lectularius]|uniref:Mos1 transposase HTH domain-containing protein n=1 Tax=Cimex lectularius TaxID=79782 RepID=A0A8I6SBY4_CIMLE|nr:histone-lysine N-methyltransferase SETMAR-like [Cimex lectularius]